MLHVDRLLHRCDAGSVLVFVREGVVSLGWMRSGKNFLSHINQRLQLHHLGDVM